MASARSGLYDDPEIYDILHAPGTSREVDGLEKIERRFVGRARSAPPRVWLEPACGSGRYLREAARRGREVVGFDLSPGMIEYATRQTRPEARDRSTYFVANMTEFARRVGRARVTFAFNLINTIRHLPSDEAMLAHFDQMSRVLAPGGVYVVGLSLSCYGAESPSEDVWVGARKRTRVTQVVQFLPPQTPGNPKGRRESVLSHLCIEHAGATEHRDSTYQLRTYSLRQWRDLIGASALRERASVDEDGEDSEAGDGHYNLFVLHSAQGAA